MPKRHHPRRGSMAYWPRVRAASPIGRIRNWPEVKTGPKILAFAGYKAGTIQVYLLDKNPSSPLYGREISTCATIIDSPPMFVCALRAYKKTDKGLQSFHEAWAENLPSNLNRLIHIPSKSNLASSLKKIEEHISEIEDIRLILSSQPQKAGIRKKKPELMEVKVGGASVKERFEFAKSLLGKEIRVSEVFKEGQFVDVIAVTKGKGFTGPVKRFGISLISHKARKGRRKPGSLGPWHPAHVMPTVARAGKMGFHQRTEYNKLILKIGSNGAEITPKGGFLSYGIVPGDYIILKGSVPGPVKRLIKLRYPIRESEEPRIKPEITYIKVD